jgi:Flp pilus assembly protein TadG
MGNWMRRRRRAQAMVEFALLAPVIFLVLLGLLDFGRAVATYVVIAEAAHDGARQLVLIKNVGQPNTVIGATLSEIGGGGVSLTPDPCMAAGTTPCPSSPTSANTGYIWMSQNLTPGNNEVTVTVTYLYAPLTGIITDAIGGGPITLTASSSMRAEY